MRLSSLACAFVLLFSSALQAQVRVTPKAAKGGEKQSEPWAEVPDTFRKMRIPQWPVPTNLAQWQNLDRAKTRATLLKCLGDLPPRSDPRQVKVLAREDKGDYIQESFEFHNG